MANDKNKTHKQYWLKNEIDKKIEDYSKLIGSTKTKLLVKIIEEYFERKIVNKEFIVPVRPFYINMKTLLAEGTVKASINKPSRNFTDYYTVKKISNNLDSFSSNYKTYCYNEDPSKHKGIFIFYIFTKEAVPVPLVMDYDLFNNELELSLIKLQDIPLLIESEEDVVTVEEIIESVKANVETWNYLADKDVDFIENEADNFYINFMASITEVIEDFSGRKKIDLLIKFRINEIENSITESISNEFTENYKESLEVNITSEDVYNMAVEQKAKINELSSELQELKDYKKEVIAAVEGIKEWFIMEEKEPEKYEEERAKLWNELQEEEKE